MMHARKGRSEFLCTGQRPYTPPEQHPLLCHRSTPRSMVSSTCGIESDCRIDLSDNFWSSRWAISRKVTLLATTEAKSIVEVFCLVFLCDSAPFDADVRRTFTARLFYAATISKGLVVIIVHAPHLLVGPGRLQVLVARLVTACQGTPPRERLWQILCKFQALFRERSR